MRDFIKREEKLIKAVNGIASTTVDKLDGLWERMGFDETQIQERLAQAHAYVRDLYNRFIEEERELEEKMLQSIATYTISINELNVELGFVPFAYVGPDTLIQKESYLKNEHIKLKQQKDQKMIELFELKQIESELCSKLDEAPAYVSCEQIPRREDIELLKENIKRLKLLRSERWNEFSQMKEEIKSNYQLMKKEPSESLIRDMLTEDMDSFAALHPDHLTELRISHKLALREKQDRETKKDGLETKLCAIAKRLNKPAEYVNNMMKNDLSKQWIQILEQNLKTLEGEKITKLKGIILNMREELRGIWDKMYFSQEQREVFVQYYTEDFCEESCTAHELEIEKLNSFYDMHRNMFLGVAKWESLFKQCCVFREREKDPNRYRNNRGNKLAEELKKMNTIKRNLPKIEDELKRDTIEWEKEHEKRFIILGVPLLEYIENQWGTIQDGDNNARFERNRKKKEQLAVEMVYGTRTPTKRGHHGSKGDLTKRSRLESTVMSSIANSKLIIPTFKGIRRKENEAPQKTFAEHRLRRRSKSATNLLNPLKGVKSTLRVHIENAFRTPQPLKKASRIPKAATEKSRKVRRALTPVVENDRLMTTVENIDQIDHPTSLKSAPAKCLGDQPLSYEDFGNQVKKTNRSSAIGVIALTNYGSYDI